MARPAATTTRVESAMRAALAPARRLLAVGAGLAALSFGLPAAAAELADLRRAHPLQPRRLGQPAAEGRDRDPAQGRAEARAGVELRRRRHAAARRRSAGPRRAVAAALSHARRRRPPGSRDDTVVAYLEERLARSRYAAIGEFHVYGADADLPVPRRMVALARQHRLVLHAHSDADAIERLFRQDPEARILWAHSGFDRPEAVRDDAAQAPQPVVRPRLPQRPGRGRQGAGRVARRCSPSFPTASWSAPTPSRPSAGTTSSSTRSWSRAWLADLPPGAGRAHRLAQRRGAVRRMGRRAGAMSAVAALAARAGALVLVARADARRACGEALRGATRRGAENARYEIAFAAGAGADRRRQALLRSTSPSARAAARRRRRRCASTRRCPSTATA